MTGFKLSPQTQEFMDSTNWTHWVISGKGMKLVRVLGWTWEELGKEILVNIIKILHIACMEFSEGIL